MLRYRSSGAVVGAEIPCVSDGAGLLLAYALTKLRAPLRRGGAHRSPGAPGARRERVPLAGLHRPARPVGHARPAGSNLRADRSMIYAQEEAAKVSGRLAGTLPAAPSLSFLREASPLLPRPWQRPPFSGQESTLLSTLSLLPRGSIVSLGRAAARTWLVTPVRPPLGYSRHTRPSSEH